MSELTGNEDTLETNEEIITAATAELAAGEPNGEENKEDEGGGKAGDGATAPGTGTGDAGKAESETKVGAEDGSSEDNSAGEDGASAESAPGADEGESASPAGVTGKSRSAWALITKKDRELRQREQALKTKEDSLAKVMKIEEDLRTDPIAFFQKHLDANSLQILQQRILNGGPSSDEQATALAQRLEKIEADHAAEKVAQEQQEKDAAEAKETEEKVTAYKADLSELAKGDEYAEGRKVAEALGLDLADEAAKYAGVNYSKTEKLVSPLEALKAVDDFAKKQRTVYRDLEASLGTPKPGTAKPEIPVIKGTPASAKTLKQVDGTTPSPPVIKTGVETEAEIIAEATEAMKKAYAAGA